MAAPPAAAGGTIRPIRRLAWRRWPAAPAGRAPPRCRRRCCTTIPAMKGSAGDRNAGQHARQRLGRQDAHARCGSPAHSARAAPAAPGSAAGSRPPGRAPAAGRTGGRSAPRVSAGSASRTMITSVQRHGLLAWPIQRACQTSSGVRWRISCTPALRRIGQGQAGEVRDRPARLHRALQAGDAGDVDAGRAQPGEVRLLVRHGQREDVQRRCSARVKRSRPLAKSAGSIEAQQLDIAVPEEGAAVAGAEGLHRHRRGCRGPDCARRGESAKPSRS